MRILQVRKLFPSAPVRCVWLLFEYFELYFYEGRAQCHE